MGFFQNVGVDDKKSKIQVITDYLENICKVAGEHQSQDIDFSAYMFGKKKKLESWGINIFNEDCYVYKNIIIKKSHEFRNATYITSVNAYYLDSIELSVLLKDGINTVCAVKYVNPELAHKFGVSSEPNFESSNLIEELLNDNYKKFINTLSKIYEWFNGGYKKDISYKIFTRFNSFKSFIKDINGSIKDIGVLLSKKHAAKKFFK